MGKYLIRNSLEKQNTKTLKERQEERKIVEMKQKFNKEIIRKWYKCWS